MSGNNTLTVVYMNDLLFNTMHESPTHRTQDVELTPQQMEILKPECEKEGIFRVIIEPRPNEDGFIVEMLERHVKGRRPQMIKKG